MKILWQGFVDPAEQRIYAETMDEYLNAIAGHGFEYAYEGISPPDRHLHRMTELRCSLDALRNVIGAPARGYDAVVMGHFQDAGLYEARAALEVPVVGLGESSMLYACQLGRKIGLITIDPVFIPWHEEQIERYRLENRVVGVRAMHTSVEDYMRAYDDEEALAGVVAQFEEQAQPLLAEGVEVLIPAGGLPALLFRDIKGFEVGGAVVLNPTAVAVKQAEVAIALARLNGTGASRRATFASPSAEALRELADG